jgi:hypothetical protein
MKLVMTLLVRNEEDILDANLRYHLAQGVDHFIIMDNRSVDGTAAIAQEYVRAGLATYLFQPDDDYAQAQWVTGMARRAYTECGADWVINNDADEFWWPVAGDLKQTFAAVGPEFSGVRAKRTNFVHLRAAPAGPFHESMVFREHTSWIAEGQPLPGKTAHRGSADVVVTQGNHRAEGLPTPGRATGVLEILHFPMRSYAQFLAKITAGGAAYRRNTTAPPTAGREWRELYAQYEESGGLHAYYDSAAYDDELIARELREGKLVEDRRLADFMRELVRP